MNEPGPARNRRRSLGHLQRTTKPSKMRPKSVTGVENCDTESSNHQINGYDNRRRTGSLQAGNIENNSSNNSDSSGVKNHVQEVCVVLGGSVTNGEVPTLGNATNGEVSNGVRMERDGRRKRRSQSEGSDGSPRSKNLQESDVGFMWTQANGHSGLALEATVANSGGPNTAVRSEDLSPLSPDVFYSPKDEPKTRPTDDMNGYVNANAHMLAFLELNGESPSTSDGENLNFLPGNHNHHHLSNSNEPNGDLEDESQSDKIDEGIALAAELEYIPLQSTKLSTSSEDQGDFIETDISQQQLGFSSYASSRGSSCSDLPNLVLAADRGDPGPHGQQPHNNNVSKDEQYSSEKIHNTCKSCDRNHHQGSVNTVEAFTLMSRDANASITGGFQNGLKSELDGSVGGHSCSNACSLLSSSYSQSAARDSNKSSLPERDFASAANSAWPNFSFNPVPSTSTAGLGTSTPAAVSRNPSSTARSSTSSFLSPDMDGEFMDLDFEPGVSNSDLEASLVNSDSAQDFVQDSPLWPSGSHANSKPQWPQSSHSQSSMRGAEGVRDNANRLGCDMYSCDTTHLSRCRPQPMDFQRIEAGNPEGTCSNCSSGRPLTKCNNCDEGCADMDEQKCYNNVNGDDPNLSEGAVGFEAAAGSFQLNSIPNDLDMGRGAGCGHDDWNVTSRGCARNKSRHYNVTHQTSTSNYNQDENSFQEDDGFDDNLDVNDFLRDWSSNRMEGAENNFAHAHNKLHSMLGVPNVLDQDIQSNRDHSLAGGQEVDENEADDEGEGTPPPIPNPRPPLNRRLELLEAHNQNLQQQRNALCFAEAASTSSLNSENQVLAGAVGGPDFRPGATNFSDDESPSRAVHLLEYQFPPGDLQLSSSRHVSRPRWMSPSTDDESPLQALSLLEHEFSASTQSAASSLSQPRRPDRGNSPVWELRHMAAMDSLADMFLVGLSSKQVPCVPGRPRLLVDGERGPGGDGDEGDGGTTERVMIWSDYEAYVLQVKQIGVSACGATAVINVLKAFELFPDKTAVCKAVKTNLRAEMSSVPEYLISRSVAGTTAQNLMEGIDELTSGEIVGRFFHFWPPRDVQLRSWLATWMKKGAVPVVTLNLQKGVAAEMQIPDAWHHQMVYGVGTKGIYVTNPLDVVSEAAIYEQLTSDSVLLVRRSDIILRWTNSANLSVLLAQSDARWCTMNVVGQVVNAMRESNRPRVPGFRPQQTSHVRIPAFYKAGVTLFVKRDSDVHRELLEASDLPLKRDPHKNTEQPAAAAKSTKRAFPSSQGKSSSRSKVKGVAGRNTRHDDVASAVDDSMDVSDAPSTSMQQQQANSDEPSTSTNTVNSALDQS